MGNLLQVKYDKMSSWTRLDAIRAFIVTNIPYLVNKRGVYEY